MNSKQKTGFKFALVCMVVFSIVYLLAAEMTLPSIPTLGGGTGTVSSPGNVSAFTWTLSGSPTQVTGVSLTFDADLPIGAKIYIELLDSGSTVLATGTKTLTVLLPLGTPTEITTSPSLDAADVANVAVTVVGP